MGFFENTMLESEYVKSLNAEQRREFVKKSKDERKKIIEDYKQKKEQLSQDDNYTKIGISNPSPQLKESFENLNLSGKLGGMFSAIGMAQMDLKQQEFMREHIAHTKQNFVLMSQNERIIKQNEEIIQLLKAIADK